MWPEYAQNSLQKAATGLTPFKCMLGFQPPLFPWSGEPSQLPTFTEWLQHSEETWNRAHIHLQRVVRIQEEQVNRRHSVHSKLSDRLHQFHSVQNSLLITVFILFFTSLLKPAVGPREGRERYFCIIDLLLTWSVNLDSDFCHLPQPLPVYRSSLPAPASTVTVYVVCCLPQLSACSLDLLYCSCLNKLQIDQYTSDSSQCYCVFWVKRKLCQGLSFSSNEEFEEFLLFWIFVVATVLHIGAFIQVVGDLVA